MGTVDLRHADATCGAKAWRLGMMLRAGLPVPPGAVVVAPTPGGGLLDGLPSELLDRPVAVRSSAVAEDGDLASFAGQLATELGVRGRDAVADAVERCATSGRSARATVYAERVGSLLPERVPVIVQQLIDADASGVLFTQDPHAGAAVTVIEASWGLGTSVVDGSVVPDLVTVADDDTVSTRRGDKQTRVDCSTVGVTTSHVAAPDRARPCLSDDEARQLAALGVVVATLVGGPVDIEWAIAGGRVWLLQVRPVTARPPQPSGTTSPDVTGVPLVRGTGAGRGTATGPAHVVRDVDGFGSVRPGDVLVCRTTDPAWTPLFGVVAAVVTETGGILSHAAIVAREVGIPAVVGAARAMAVVTGGSLVHVDGDAGTVSRFAPGDGGQQ